jgi:thioredoxin reductase (NADPH)
VARGTAVWECVIVGSGPAGLSAAVYMGRFRRRTLALDCGDGRWAYGQVNDNYLGFPAGVSAVRLRNLGRAQARRFGVVFRDAEVTAVHQGREGFRLVTRKGTVRARTVIWAAGVHDLWPEFAGARRLVGRHLFWCIVCDGWRARDRRVLVLGENDHAASTTLQFLTYTRQVTLVTDPERGRLSWRARARLSAAGITLLTGRVRRVVASKKGIDRVVLGDGRVLEADLVFSLYGGTPRTDLLRGLDVALTRSGYVRIDDKNRTSHPRLFAAGDVSDKHSHQVASAVHEGATAAQAANQVLYPPYQRL